MNNLFQLIAGIPGNCSVDSHMPRRGSSKPKESKNPKPTFIDIFSGCGGLSSGFVQAGWQPLYGVELLKAPSQSYARNFKCGVWNGDVRLFADALESGEIKLPEVNAVVGGPPCQGFSPLGKMSAKTIRLEHHQQLNLLWQQFARIVRFLQPEIILTENVPEFLASEQFLDFEVQMKKDLGYEFTAGVLHADAFGVPQKRKRAFAIGSRLGALALPGPTGERADVRSAIGHLPLEPDGRNWHIGRNPTPMSLERYKVVPEGGNRFDLMRERPDITPPCWLNKPTGTTDVFGRLRWDRPSSTIRTEFYKPEKGRYLHPEAHRPITHREAACLQTFPKDFIFEGSKIEVAGMIGEAVPPKLAFAIARQMIQHLRHQEQEAKMAS